MKTALPLALMFLFAAAGPASAAESSKSIVKPNIIFVLADDLGIDGVSCYGADKHKTPHIDALAASGLRFTTCYAAPLCGPSRCLLMTGRYAFRTGGLTNQSWRRGGPGAKSVDEYPVARLLKDAGYATGQAGKWRQVGARPMFHRGSKTSRLSRARVPSCSKPGKRGRSFPTRGSSTRSRLPVCACSNSFSSTRRRWWCAASRPCASRCRNSPTSLRGGRCPAEIVEPSELAEWLVANGYKRVDAVEYPGEFSRRRHLRHLPAGRADPVRLEFFGDEVESIRTFAVGSHAVWRRRPAWC